MMMTFWQIYRLEGQEGQVGQEGQEGQEGLGGLGGQRVKESKVQGQDLDLICISTIYKY